MARGILNLIIGVVMIVGAASGELVMRGTNSSAALGVIGLVVAGLGIFRVVRSLSTSNQNAS